MKLYSKDEIRTSVRNKAALQLRRLVEKQVRKELAKRRRKMARRLIVLGVSFTIGCVIYAFSDRMVDFVGDWILAAMVNGKKHKAAISGRNRK